MGEYDGTPDGFGRVAAATARQVIFQRLRDAEDEQKYGHFSAVEGDIVTGVVQQGRDSRTVLVDLGKIEAIMPLAEQVPGERYTHGTRLRVYVVAVRRELRGLQVVVSRTHPALVERLFALEVPEIADGTVEIKAVAREAGHRSKIAVTSHNPDVSAKGACIGPMGSRVRAVMHELERREDRHRRLVGRPGDVRRAGALAGQGHLGDRRRRGRPLGPGRRARLPALAGHRPRGSERPARRPAHRVADRHPARTPRPQPDGVPSPDDRGVPDGPGPYLPRLPAPRRPGAAAAGGRRRDHGRRRPTTAGAGTRGRTCTPTRPASRWRSRSGRSAGRCARRSRPPRPAPCSSAYLDGRLRRRGRRPVGQSRQQRLELCTVIGLVPVRARAPFESPQTPGSERPLMNSR